MLLNDESQLKAWAEFFSLTKWVLLGGWGQNCAVLGGSVQHRVGDRENFEVQKWLRKELGYAAKCIFLFCSVSGLQGLSRFLLLLCGRLMRLAVFQGCLFVWDSFWKLELEKPFPRADCTKLHKCECLGEVLRLKNSGKVLQSITIVLCLWRLFGMARIDWSWDIREHRCGLGAGFRPPLLGPRSIYYLFNIIHIN